MLLYSVVFFMYGFLWCIIVVFMLSLVFCGNPVHHGTQNVVADGITESETCC